MALLTAAVTIVGIRPLFWNAFGPDAIPLTKKPRTGVAGNDPEEWRRTMRATESGQLYLEPAAVFGCIRTAAKYTSRRRGTLQPVVAATLQVLAVRVLVDRRVPKGGLANLAGAEDKPLYIDVRSVVNPGTKGRNIRYRVAASPGWKTSFSISWDNTMVTENEMRSVLYDAGRFVGLGDGRTIGFGRFEISDFRIRDSPNAEKPPARRIMGTKAAAHLEA